MFNPFVDLSAITRTYRLEQQKSSQMMDGTQTYQDKKLPVAASAGMGVKLHMNTNFILSVDFGKAFDPELSDFMVGMATTYVF